eukprot:2257247-Pleurochrysis_carterae.AAC.3
MAAAAREHPDPEPPRWPVGALSPRAWVRSLNTGCLYHVSITIISRLPRMGALASRQIPVKNQIGWYTPSKACVVQ